MIVSIVVVFAACVVAKSWSMPLLANVSLPINEGTNKDVRIYVNHHFLKMNPDGLVNGSQTMDSGETVWHRIAQSDGILLRSSFYCNYFCINECGYGYSALLPNNECLWTEYYDEHNYRFILKRFGNRTAYLSVNMLGKLKRTVLLKKENLGTNIEQSHIMVREYDGPALNATCKGVNLKKIDYKPIKTCKNPPRPKKLKDKRETEDVVVSSSSESPMSSIVVDDKSVIVPVNLTSIMSDPIVPPDHRTTNHSVMEVSNEAVVGKSFDYVIDPNRTYYKEIINIKTLPIMINMTHTKETTIMDDDDSTTTIASSTEALVKEMIKLSGTNTSTIDPDIRKRVFSIIKYTKTCTFFLS